MLWKIVKKRINKIPEIYLPIDELDRDLKSKVKKEGITNVR